MTVSCPLDCEYLQDARRHDKPVEVDVAQVPNRDIQVKQSFLSEHEQLLVFLGQTLATAALETPGAVDFDVREALEALIRTHRTLQSGVYYESVPANPLAASLYAAMQRAAEEFRKQERERLGMSKTRDADVLGALVFLQRLEYDRNNGRRKGRAFIDYMSYLRRDAAPAESPSLLLP